MVSAPVANQKPKLLFPALGLNVPAHLEGPSRPWGGGFSWTQLRAVGLQLGPPPPTLIPPRMSRGSWGLWLRPSGSGREAGVFMISTITAAQRGPAFQSPPRCMKGGASELYSIRAGRSPSQPSNPAPPFTDGEIEAQKGDEICTGSHSRSRLPAWTLSWIHTEGREVDRQPDADPTWHCPPLLTSPCPTALQALQTWAVIPKLRPHGSFVMVSRVRKLPRACLETPL